MGCQIIPHHCLILQLLKIRITDSNHSLPFLTLKAKRIKQTPRKIFLSKRADKDGLRDHMAQFKDEFLSSAHKNTSVNEMWVNFKT